MPGLRRDVLRWLVALNLSFPIKNIKRDFSNGFMVAEIFSRYFPQDIHMHSYDYGSRIATKRDNWEQLNKFFRRKGFTVMKDDIDNIITCTTDEGAGSLLERMYNFLTQKPSGIPGSDGEFLWVCEETFRYLPENSAVQPSVERRDPSQACYSGPDEYTSGDENREDQSSRSGSQSYSRNDNDGDGDEEECESRQEDGGIQRNPDDCGYDSKPLVRLGENGIDFFASLDGGVRFLDDDGNQHLEEVMVLVEEKVSRRRPVNAVEKARHKEVARARNFVKSGLKGSERKHGIAGRKSSTEVGLAFRNPNRRRKGEFKQYTLPDYRRQKQFGYVQLGSLGPSDQLAPELVEKRQILQRVKEFGRYARSCNTMAHSNPALADVKTPPKPSSRKVALEFASSIPKPKRKNHSKENSRKKPLPIPNPYGLTELQILEAKHHSHKQHVEAIRRDLEHFLR